MSEERQRLTFNTIRFIIEIISMVLVVLFAYGTIDKRVTIIENEITHKIDDQKFFEKIEKMKEDLEKKIETEFNKYNSRKR